MINSGDYVLVYRNNDLYFIGKAGCVRGFDQKYIIVYCSSDWSFPAVEVDRHTGVCKDYKSKLHAKVVTKEVWDTALEEKKRQDAERDLKIEVDRLIKQEKERVLLNEAEAWYETLPDNQKKMVDALCYSRYPIVVG